MTFSFQGLIESVQNDSSAKVLILSNLITIVLAVVFSWSVFVIVWIYWFQSVIIGFFNFIRIITLENRLILGEQLNQITSLGKIFLGFFFVFHYGIFHLVYLVFLVSITFVFPLFGGNSVAVDFGYVFLVAIIFFLNHLFSYIKFKDSPKKYTAGSLMFFPYIRIIPMHIIIIVLVQGFVIDLSGASAATSSVLVLFLLMKTAADLIMHSIEHKEQLLEKVVSKTGSA
ncbi:MAG: hypothetical protein COT90_03925 [Candidatus Diapherotrites archaeon CG10_big_fil_rev_8_21_14_0_10_31_34]|nr:MAG: hypothetical protein COT90_03925 [Candidatus Diapherotrites archaeon CG10_big_fil_rev_8_21_14_0_10_31_34]PJA20329.1 MAG: hypothetical protein COX63_00895 [Candidatus Diapherotrites archaeon CG_4_10_14_0_2_um_filter_31_5]